MQVAIIEADAEGVIRRRNPAAGSLLGHRADEALGATLDLIVPAHPREMHWAGFHRAMRNPTIKDMAADLPVLCADGQVRTFTGRLLVLIDPFGKALGALTIYSGDGSTGLRPFG